MNHLQCPLYMKVQEEAYHLQILAVCKFILDFQTGCTVYSLHMHMTSGPPAFQHATLKSWEGPGDEANICIIHH